MLSVYNVANYFLSCVDPDDDDCISNLKLQKLCYYAQGFYLAMYGKRLFDNDIRAWQHGPVVAELYHKYKNEHASCLIADADFDINSIPENIRSFLDDVYQTYGQFSAWRLREMTHQETPWQNSYNKTANDIISDEEMIKFFKSRLA